MSWYRQVLGGQSPPSREHLYSIATERSEIYRCRSPEVIQVPILVILAAVEDGIPGEEEVAQLVWILKRGRYGGPSVMRAEDLKEWLQ